MKYVALDTSGKNLTVICRNGDKTESFYDKDCGTNHSVAVMEKLSLSAKKVNLDLADVDFFAVVVGAGSFTGIRIGVATVKALCFAYKKPCLSITSFDTVAYNKQGEKLFAVINANHDSFYVCGYDKNCVTVEPCFVSKQQLLDMAKGYKLYSFEKIEGLKTKVVSQEKGLICAVEQNTDKASFDLEKVLPLYIRKSQAEEGR